MELSPLIRRVWQLAASEAVQAKEEFIQPDHLFLAVLKAISAYDQWKKAARDLAKDQRAELEAPPPILEEIRAQFTTVGLDPDRVRRQLRQRRGQGQYEWPEKRATVHRSEATHRIFRESAAHPDAEVLLTDVFLALLDEQLLEEGGKRLDVLREFGIDLARLRVALASPPGPDSHATVHPAPADEQGRAELKPAPAGHDKSAARQARVPRRPTPTIDRFTRDLTQMARDGKLTEPIGRKKEMLQVVRTLSRETKNNPVLVGEAGVGKTAVVEGLAWRIAKGRAPRAVLDTRIVQLDMAALTAGTKYRGEFEERLNGIMREARDHPDMVVFVDEIHQLMGAGAVGSGVLDAGELLKPALARGEIRMIGATTSDEYRLIEKDKALERRFQPVPVKEPTRAEAIEILAAVAKRKTDVVTIHPGVVEAAVDLAIRYMSDRRLPDSAIDLLEEACSLVAVQWTSRIPGEEFTADDDEVTVDTLAAVIEGLKGIPAGRLKEADRERLGRMADALKDRVIGQDAACDLVAEAVQRARAGLVAPGRPLRVLLFLGPTGVGKTQLAKATAEYLFGSEQALARLDMSEFHEQHTVSRLIGSPPGYVGFDEEPQLTRILRRQPHCVLLLDEFDRAHPAVQDLFLQVFDEGRVTDAKGRTADAANVLFILTSNLSAGVREKVGFRARGFDEARRALVDQGLKPEIVNRVDDVVVFRPLDASDVARIADRLLRALRERLLSQQGIGLRWDERVVQLLASEGHSVEFGVRELKRVVERRVESPIASMVIQEQVTRGRVVALSVADGDLVATVAATDEGTSV